MKHTTKGAFGGHYNHQVIKELRAELAKSRIMLAALVEHTQISQDHLLKIAADYVAKQHAQMATHKDI